MKRLPQYWKMQLRGRRERSESSSENDDRRPWGKKGSIEAASNNEKADRSVAGARMGKGIRDRRYRATMSEIRLRSHYHHRLWSKT